MTKQLDCSKFSQNMHTLGYEIHISHMCLQHKIGRLNFTVTNTNPKENLFSFACMSVRQLDHIECTKTWDIKKNWSKLWKIQLSHTKDDIVLLGSILYFILNYYYSSFFEESSKKIRQILESYEIISSNHSQ